MTTLSLVDSHCHIPLIEIEGGVDAIIDNAQSHDVNHMLCVSIDLDTFPAILELAKQYSCISASVGIHPNTELNSEVPVDELVKLAAEPEIVAIGETGLDYFRSSGNLDWQRDRFRDHILAAKEIKKPLIIHCREASSDVIRLLREEGADQVGGVMHCFVEDLDTAKKAIDLNFLISFSGIVTFKNAIPLKTIAKELPDNSIIVETDSPYLAPVPYRGKLNQPAYVRHVAEHIADLRDINLEEFANLTTANYKRVFSQ